MTIIIIIIIIIITFLVDMMYAANLMLRFTLSHQYCRASCLAYSALNDHHKHEIAWLHLILFGRSLNFNRLSFRHIAHDLESAVFPYSTTLIKNTIWPNRRLQATTAGRPTKLYANFL